MAVPGMLMIGGAGQSCGLGEALRMRAALGRLMAKHGVEPQATVLAPLPPIEGAFWTEGLAAGIETDKARQRFRPWALSWPRDVRDIPLLIRHQSDQVAGAIERLSYTRAGAVAIEARVTNPAAATFPAFSVGAKVTRFEMQNEDSDQFCGCILEGEIIEVSMTDAPANPECLVNSRIRVPQSSIAFEAMIEHTVRAQLQLKALMA